MNHRIYLAALLLSTFPSAPAQQPTSVPSSSCATPTILRVIKSGNDLYYQVDQSRAHKLFTLGEVSNAVRSCPEEKTLFVVADPDVPIQALIVPEKEQISKVRYFIKFNNGSIQEFAWKNRFLSLPVSDDIHPVADTEDSLRPPTKTPTTKGPL